MKDLTNEQKATLLSDVKSFLNITWDDDQTDREVWQMTVSAMRRIDDIAGDSLDYLADEDTEGDDLYLSMSFLGKDLLLNRVHYEREKALDDFESNYLNELTSLYLQGRAYAEE